MMLPILRGYKLKGLLTSETSCGNIVWFLDFKVPAFIRLVIQFYLAMSYSSHDGFYILKGSVEMYQRIFCNAKQGSCYLSNLRITKFRKGSIKIEVYLDSVKSIANNLALAGKIVKIIDLITQLLVGLDEEYTLIVC